jgi:hypothetical protein
VEERDGDFLSARDFATLLAGSAAAASASASSSELPALLPPAPESRFDTVSFFEGRAPSLTLDDFVLSLAEDWLASEDPDVSA